MRSILTIHSPMVDKSSFTTQMNPPDSRVHDLPQAGDFYSATEDAEGPVYFTRVRHTLKTNAL